MRMFLGSSDSHREAEVLSVQSSCNGAANGSLSHTGRPDQTQYFPLGKLSISARHRGRKQGQEKGSKEG